MERASGPALDDRVRNSDCDVPDQTFRGSFWLFRTIFFSWVSPLMATGARRTLQASDMLPLEGISLQPAECERVLWHSWTQETNRSRSLRDSHKTSRTPSLLRALLSTYGRTFSVIAVAKLANDALSFSGPLLLQLLVVWITQDPDPDSDSSTTHTSGASSVINTLQSGGSDSEWDPSWIAQIFKQLLTPGSPLFGYSLAAALGITSAVKALINAHSGYQLSRLNCRLRAGLMCILHKKALLIGAADYNKPGSAQSGSSNARSGSSVGRVAGSSGADTGSTCYRKPATKQINRVPFEVQTLMSVDVGRVLNLGPSLNEAWSLPLQVAVALYLLYTQVRFAFVGGLAVSLLLIPINRWIAIRIQAASADMMTYKDARIRCTLELLHNVRTIKANGWEEIWEVKVKHHRKRELKGLAVRKYLDALCVYFWAVTSLLFSTLTFGLAVLMGTPLSLSSTFTSLALFQLLIGPLNALPWVLNGVVEAVVSVRRLESYLSLPELKRIQSQHLSSQDSTAAASSPRAAGALLSQTGEVADCVTSADCATDECSSHTALIVAAATAEISCPALSTPSTSSQPTSPEALNILPPAVLFSRATFHHSRSPLPALQDISLSIPTEGLIVVVGPVGSGKSTFLTAILGELQPSHGSITFNRLPALPESFEDQSLLSHSARSVRGPSSAAGDLGGSGVAFASQDPWVMAGTVRENILVGQQMQAQRYSQALYAAALMPDLVSMPLGDLTYVGERGATLSGGQKARLSLARALYARCSLYVIDDVLSSLDATCAAHVVQHGLLGDLMRGSTRVIVTHSPRCLQAAHLVVQLQEGRVVFAGSSAAYTAHCNEHAVLDSRSEYSRITKEQQQQQQSSTSTGSIASNLPNPAAPAAIPNNTIATDFIPLESKSLIPTASVEDEADTSRSNSLHHTHQNLTRAADSEENSISQLPAASSAGDTSALPVPAVSGDGGIANMTEEDRGVGHVSWPVYLSYFKAVGWGTLTVVLISLCAMQASKMASDLWVAHHVSSPALTALHPSLSLVVGAPDTLWLYNSGVGSYSGALFITLRSWLVKGPTMHSGSSSRDSSSSSSSSNTSSSKSSSSNSSSSGSSGGSWRGSSSGARFNLSSQGSKNNMSRGSESVRRASSGVESATELLTTHLKGNDRHPHAQTRRLKAGSSRLQILFQNNIPYLASLKHPSSEESQFSLKAPSTHAVHLSAIPPPPAVAAAVAAAAMLAPKADMHQDSMTISNPQAYIISPLAQRSNEEMLFLYGLLLLSVLNGVCTLVRAFSFAFAGMSAARKMHDALLQAVVGAPMSFLGSEPVGRMINRFSSDTSTVDDSLPFMLNILLANAVALVGLLAIMCYSSPGLCLLLLPLGFVYRRLQLYYRHTAREVRRLDSLALSPVYCAFGEATHAAVSIRAFGVQSHFSHNCQTLIGRYQRASLTGAAVSTWLGLRLQLLAAVLVTAVALLAANSARSPPLAALLHNLFWRAARHSGTLDWKLQINGEEQDQGVGGPGMVTGLAALSLTYTLQVVGLLNGLLTSSAESEQEMVAVERVSAYCNIQPQQEKLLLEAGQPQLQSPPAQSPQQAQPPTTPAHTHQHTSSPQQTSTPCLASAALLGTLSNVPDSTAFPHDSEALPDPDSKRCLDPDLLGVAVLEFQHVMLRYSRDAQLALAGCSFRLLEGQSLGVCGRTGAGKSSLLAAALRLTETISGRVLLGGVDTHSIPLRQLRRHFAILPQSAFVFAGSIRDNLDPWGRHHDSHLESALRDVQLWSMLLSSVQQWQTNHSYLTTQHTGTPCGSLGKMRLPSLSSLSQPLLLHPNEFATTTSVLDVQLAGGCSISSSAGGHAQRGNEEDADGVRLVVVSSPGDANEISSGADLSRQQTQSASPALQIQLSAGQQQLLCLARLLLQIRGSTDRSRIQVNLPQDAGSSSGVTGVRSGAQGRGNRSVSGACDLDRSRYVQSGEECKVVLLDEITAHVDPATAKVMQEVLHRVLRIGMRKPQSLSTAGLRQPGAGINHGVGCHAGDSCSIGTADVDVSRGGVGDAWGFERGGRGRLSVLQVAHNLSAIVQYDQVIVMSGGVVMEAGCPAELMAVRGHFAQLASQAML